MSDLQIVTGLAILVSGYAQLCNGMLTCDWQLLTYTAWFSSLTHLSCLTLLRHFLSRNPIQRMWRLVAMFVIVALLVTAIGSECIISRESRELMSFLRGSEISRPPRSYAACSFYASSWEGLPEEAVPCIVSIILIGTAFISRLVKAFEGISVDKIGRIGHKIDQSMRMGLRKVHRYAHRRQGHAHPARALLYWPLGIAFYMWCIWIDFVGSMSFEVLWLIISFAWGLVRLAAGLRLCQGRQYKWSFGQTLPIFLLFAPLLTFGGILAATNESTSRQSGDQVPSTAARTRPNHLHDPSVRTATVELRPSSFDPDESVAANEQPFCASYVDASFTGDAVLYVAFIVTATGIAIIAYQVIEFSIWFTLGIFWLYFVYKWLPVEIIIYSYNFTLLRFQLELLCDAYMRNMMFVRTMLRTALFLVWSALFVYAALLSTIFLTDSISPAILSFGPPFCYCTFWALKHVFERTRSLCSSRDISPTLPG